MGDPNGTKKESEKGAAARSVDASDVELKDAIKSLKKYNASRQTKPSCSNQTVAPTAWEQLARGYSTDPHGSAHRKLKKAALGIIAQGRVKKLLEAAKAQDK